MKQEKVKIGMISGCGFIGYLRYDSNQTSFTIYVSRILKKEIPVVRLYSDIEGDDCVFISSEYIESIQKL